MEHKRYSDLSQEEIKNYESQGLIVKWAGYAGYCVFEPIFKIEDINAYCDRLQSDANQRMESNNKAYVNAHRTGGQAMLELFVILTVLFTLFFVILKLLSLCISH